MAEGECRFCAIIQGKIPAKMVYEDSWNIGFLDINPRNPGHTLVVPKKHYEFLSEMTNEDASRLLPAVKAVASKVRNATQAQGVSIVQNNGQAAGQAVAHVHFHVIPRFATEGPVAMEAIMPVKKMDEQSLDKMAALVKSAPEGSAPPVQEPKAEKLAKAKTLEDLIKDD